MYGYSRRRGHCCSAGRVRAARARDPKALAEDLVKLKVNVIYAVLEQAALAGSKATTTMTSAFPGHAPIACANECDMVRFHREVAAFEAQDCPVAPVHPSHGLIAQLEPLRAPDPR